MAFCVDSVFFFYPAEAAELRSADESGRCGNGCTWELVNKTGVLTISGTGVMTSSNWSKYNPAIKKLEINHGIVSISVGAFRGCSQVRSVTIPSSVRFIENNAFERCDGLKSVTIPDSVISIGYFAFGKCIGLESVIIGNSVTSIGNSAFYYCSGLTSVTLGKSVSSIGSGTFEGCSKLKTITIPRSVTYIDLGAFAHCTSLSSVKIPDSVIFSGGYTFNGCTELTSISLGSSLTFIGDRDFYGCSKLSSITIPETVTRIGSHAFDGCTGLKSITIPEAVTYIEFGAFDNCSGLHFNEEGGALYLGNEKNKYHALIKAKDEDITSCRINQNTKVIAGGAFSGCSSLRSVTIPDSVISIGATAFSGCSRLTSVSLGNSVITIGMRAFFNCTSLKSITIPDSVTFIGNSAFIDCSMLQYKEEACAKYLGNEGNKYFALIEARNKSITSCDIANTTKVIADRAFFECKQMKSVTIPNSVVSIGRLAFYYCSGLTSVDIPDSVTYLGDYSFFECYSLTSVTIGRKVTSIGSDTFLGCSRLTSVVIPDSVTSIGPLAFYDCRGLTSVTIPDSVTSIGSLAFCGCSGLTSVTIPDSVTVIEDRAFHGCTNLTSVLYRNLITVNTSDFFFNCPDLLNYTAREKNHGNQANENIIEFYCEDTTTGHISSWSVSGASNKAMQRCDNSHCVANVDFVPSDDDYFSSYSDHDDYPSYFDPLHSGNDRDPGSNNVAIIVSVVIVGIVAIAAIVVVVIIMKIRRRKKQDHQTLSCHETETNLECLEKSNDIEMDSPVSSSNKKESKKPPKHQEKSSKESSNKKVKKPKEEKKKRSGAGASLRFAGFSPRKIKQSSSEYTSLNDMIPFFSEVPDEIDLEEALLIAELNAQYIMSESAIVAKRAEQNGVLSKYGIDFADAQCIAMYTLDVPREIGRSPYLAINSALCGPHTPEDLAKYRNLIVLLLRSLRKLPRVQKAVLYRGIRIEDEKGWLEVGKKMVFQGFTSTSTNMTISDSFSSGKSGHILVVEGPVSGYEIQEFSQFPHECEILLEPEIVVEVSGSGKANAVVQCCIKPSDPVLVSLAPFLA